MVDSMERERSELQDRMDRDFDRYNLEPYQGELDEDGEAIIDGYKHFTSNDPRTTMNLALHLGSTARRTIRVLEARAQDTQREINNMKEMFCLGILASIDERRHNLLMPDLQDSIFSQCTFRGRYAQRVLLVKEDLEPDEEAEGLGNIGLYGPMLEEAGFGDMLPETNTRTYVDVSDWDPRNTYWALGKHGLAWACHKSMKTADDIEAEYDMRPEGASPRGAGTDSAHEFSIYDFFDETHNTVVLENGVELKKRTPHGMKRVPVALGLVGPLPLFQADGHDYDANYGEGFFQSDRAIFDEQNFMYSVIAELSKRSIKQPLKVFSRDGTLTLDADPRQTGAEVSLATGDDQDLSELPPMQMVRESGTFLGIISAMMQRGSFPSSAFGELGFTLSGFAITQLRQGLEAPITPHLKATRGALKEVLDILADTYADGDFDTLTLSGRMQNAERSYFSEEISPELVAEGGTIEVNLRAHLPQDDASRMTLAQLAREGPNGVPLLDDRFLREEILEIQDVQQVERAIWEQVAERGSPVAVAFNNMMAAAQQGNQELAQIWQSELQTAMTTKLLEMAQLQAMSGPTQPGGGAPGGGGGQGSPRRTRMPTSDVLPPEAMGINSRPNMQSGPNVPPGTPRPGAGAGLEGFY